MLTKYCHHTMASSFLKSLIALACLYFVCYLLGGMETFLDHSTSMTLVATSHSVTVCLVKRCGCLGELMHATDVLQCEMAFCGKTTFSKKVFC